MTPTPEFSPEALLAHAGWMRALALGLVRDPNEADDVAQDAALAALLHPPPADAALRPWLGQVVRRFAWRRARSERRRADREAEAHEPAGPEDAGETLARLDLQRALLDAVRSLEEPVRSTLVQRYFEGRTAADIAAKVGVPASTVRARLARGLELLRERLDRVSESRGAWMALIAPLVPRELRPTGIAAGTGAVTASTVTVGALTMTKLFLVASAAVVGGLAWWNLAPRGAPESPRAVAPLEAAPAATLRAADDRGTEILPAATASVRSAAVEPEADAPQDSKPVEAAALVGRIDLRVVDPGGNGWAGALLEVLMPYAEPPRTVAQAVTDAEGRAEIDVELSPFARRPEGSAAANFFLVVRRSGCASRRLEVVVAQDRTAHLGDVVLEEAAVVRGHVVDGGGGALAGAHVGAIPLAAFEGLDDLERASFARVGNDLADVLLATRSAADGAFELADVAPGGFMLWAYAVGHRYALSEPLELDEGALADGQVLVVPALATGDRIAGQLVGPDGVGRPGSLSRDVRDARGRRVDFVKTDPQGRFDFAVDHLDAVYDLSAMDGYQEFANAHARGLRPGDVDVRIVFGRGRSLTLHVVDEDGAPVSEARVRSLEGGVSYEAHVTSSAPGEVQLECPGTAFRLEVTALGFRETSSALYEAGSAPETIEIRMPRATRVVGRVTAAGAPIAGAKVEGFPYDERGRETVNGLSCTISSFECGTTSTDSDGHYELFLDADESVVVRASAAGWVDGESDPIELAYIDPVRGLEVDLDLGSGGVIEGRVLMAASGSAAGRIVGAHRGDGRALSTRTAEDGTFRFEGLMPGDWYVLPLETEVPPHGGAYASYSGSEPMPFNARVEAGHTTRFDLELD